MTASGPNLDREPAAFWSIPSAKILDLLETKPEGLTDDEARRRLIRFGANTLKTHGETNAFTLLLSQFKSPIILILFFAAGLSFFLSDATDAIIILAIVLISGLLGFWQEKGATDAVRKLLAIVQIKAQVFRDQKPKEIPVEEIVFGDVVILNAGDVIPADCFILESKDFFVDEATLTGETFPVEKTSGTLPLDTALSQRKNSLYMGTHVTSGTGKAVVVCTGKSTEFGKVAERLKLKQPETEFERGVRRFGYFLMEVTLLVIAIFAVNVFLSRPVLDSFLFAMALAVGLTPQLLPAIISVNLAHGAKRMATAKVIVKRLASIENFGSMNVLCVDKTGTLTEGVVHVQSALDADGKENENVLQHAYFNSFFQAGYTNPIDEAIRNHCQFKVSGYEKLDEVPYDFVRKRLSILLTWKGSSRIVTKGALQNVLSVCSKIEISAGKIVDIAEQGEKLQKRFEELSEKGFRTLGVAYRDVGNVAHITKSDEADMTFLGFLVLFDPLKPEIVKTISNLGHLGISLKIITGDNHLVAAQVGSQLGLSQGQVLNGLDLHQMSDEALAMRVRDVSIFAEIEPNQKERLILALKKAGNVVGYMGDGINDASALHAADVGISVDCAVDVAKQAADIILLEKDLDVLTQGVKEGRTTFANTLKYVFMATSANFGNMFSMAGASLFLPFLPLLPKQILLNNLLTDFPEMTIATDNVDPELVDKPRRWDIKFIRNYMLTFGILSSVFDFLAFGVLLFILHADPAQFRTGWFIESVISAPLVVLVIRTRRPFFKSMPGKLLLAGTLLTVVASLVLPFTLLGRKLFSFTPLPPLFFALIGAIIIFYILAAEFAKKIFYRKVLF